MHTLIQGLAANKVMVSSRDGEVAVKVASGAFGLPAATLSRQEAHDALVEARDRAEDFIAAVEGDIEATAG